MGKCKKRPYSKKVIKRVTKALSLIYDAPLNYYKCMRGDHYHVGNLPSYATLATDRRKTK